MERESDKTNIMGCTSSCGQEQEQVEETHSGPNHPTGGKESKLR